VGLCNCRLGSAHVGWRQGWLLEVGDRASAMAVGLCRERPGLKQYRLLSRILWKGIDLERRSRSEQAAGSARDWESIVFYFESFWKVSLLNAGAGRSRWLGAAGIEKVWFFHNPFKKYRFGGQGLVGAGGRERLGSRKSIVFYLDSF